MRRLLLVAILFLTGCASVTSTVLTENNTKYQQIIEVPGQGKDVIYERSRVWIAQTFKSAKDVIQYESKDEGVIIIKGAVHNPFSGAMAFAPNIYLTFTMKEDIKDGRARATFDNILIEQMRSKWTVRNAREVEGAERAITRLAESLKSYLTTAHAADNW